MANNTVGISCEVALMEYFNMSIPDIYYSQLDRDIVDKVKALIKTKVSKHFKRLNIKVDRFSGENSGEHDFILNGGKTLSVKSNKSKLSKVCPQVIGQATTTSFLKHFNVNLDNADKTQRIVKIKELFNNNLEEMLKTFWGHTMHSDFLLYFYEVETSPKYILLNRNLLQPDFKECSLRFSNSEKTGSVYKNETKIAELQFHDSRDVFKFRFLFNNILKNNVYIKERISLYNLDCFEFLKSIPDKSVDLALLDPPYIVSRETRFADGEEKGTDVDRFRLSYNFGEWDLQERKTFLKDLMGEIYRILKPKGTVICFYDLWKITNLATALETNKFKQLRYGEWIKSNPVPINSKTNYLTNSREVFVSAVKGGSPTFNSEYDNGVYSYPIYQGKYRFHPTQKPVELFKDLILKHSNPEDVVLDCFSGSGTTAVASFETNRKFIGTELDYNYYIQSLERMEDVSSN